MMDDQKNKTFPERIKQIATRLLERLFEPSADLKDERDRLRAYIAAILSFIFILVDVFGIFVLIFAPEFSNGAFPVPAQVAAFGVMLAAYALSRSKHYVWGIWLLFIPMLIPSFLSYSAADFALAEFWNKWILAPLLIGSLLLPRYSYFMILSAIALLVPFVQIFTWPSEADTTISSFVFLLISTGLLGILLRFQARLETLGLEAVQAKSLAEKEGIIQQLQQAEALQQQRARIIEASYEINSKLATILEPQQLIREVINQVQELFRYNYVQLYLLDEAGENLVVAGGTGEAGQVLFSRGHHIPVGKGLVGQAAATNAYVLVDDVSEIGTWISNPLLPNTKSELAVPIATGETVFGVLDVQNDEVGALTTEDVALLQSVATAVAISLQNARLYEQANKRAEQEAIVNQINQQILSAPDIERILQVVAQELGRTLKAQNTTIQLSVGQKLAENGRNNGERN